MKRNNRGMTLIEMIVAFAILGVVSVAIFSMMLTATKTYTNLTSTVKLQYEAQLAMANVERYMVNCNEGMYWDGKTLFLINEEEGAQSLQVVYLKDGELFYGSDELANGSTSTLYTYLLAEHVTGMNVATLTDAEGLIRQAELTLTFQRNNKTYTGKKTIALRNKPSGKYTGTLNGTIGFIGVNGS